MKFWPQNRCGCYEKNKDDETYGGGIGMSFDDYMDIQGCCFTANLVRNFRIISHSGDEGEVEKA